MDAVEKISVENFSNTEWHNYRLGYRPEIDGLRAVSIIGVVLYHLFPSFISGGFSGVDVFFVISGYVISRIVFASLAVGRFSFVEFYLHRIRRILPGLLLVMATCIAVGWNLLLASEYSSLGRHVASSVIFMQNFNLLKEVGYFDVDSLRKPLMHLWSLSIEEQFYLFFPVLAWTSWRYRQKPIMLALMLFVPSFISNLVHVHFNPTSAFLMPQDRVWELAVGIALAAIPPVRLSGMAADLSSILGFMAILVGMVALNGTLAYPGAWAAIPVGGAALLMCAGPQGWVNRHLLGHSISVFIGRISYPLYLWHWPLISFVTIVRGRHPDGIEGVQILIGSLVLAWATNRFIERPFRLGTGLSQARATVLVGLCVVLWGVGYSADYLRRRHVPAIENIAKVWEFSGYPRGTGARIDGDWVVFGHNAANRIAVIGDSHAQQYENSIATFYANHAPSGARIYPETAFRLKQAAFPPSPLDLEVANPTINTVVLSYFWAFRYGNGTVDNRVRCCGKGLAGVIDMQSPPLGAQEMDAIDAQLEVAIQSLIKAGKKVYLIADNPFGPEIAPRMLLERHIWRGIMLHPTTLERKTALARREPVHSRLVAIAARFGATVVDPMDDLCPAAICPALSPEGMPYYKDYDHLSLETVTSRIRFLDSILESGEN